MGLIFLVFDKKKKYTSVIGDILDITGNKLLVAFNEEKVRELLSKVRIDIMLLEFEDIDVWLNNLENSNYAKPIFFLQDYRQVEELIKIGFVEENFLVLPFNPLDLLSNAVFISKEASQEVNKGFINTMLDILRRKLSVNVDIGNGCTISIKNGIIRGFTCSEDQLINTLKQNFAIEFLPYQEGLVVRHTVKSNSELFRALIRRKIKLKEEKPAVPLQEIVKESVLHPIEILEGIYWVGSFSEGDILQPNTFLRIYKKETVQIPILINAGNKQDYADIKNKIEEIIGSIENLKAVVVMGFRVDDYINAYNFMQLNPTLYIITTLPIAKELTKLDVPMRRIRLIEQLDNGVMRLATGDTLRFISTPFCPDKGSFVFYEELTGVLFSGYLFSFYVSNKTFSRNEDIDFESLEIFHTVNMPSTHAIRNAIKAIKNLSIKAILPKYGNVIWNVKEAISILEKVKAGFETLKTNESDVVLIVKDLIRKCKQLLNDKKFSSLMQVISRYIYVSDDLEEVEVYVNAEFLPSIFLISLMSSGVESEAILEVIKFLYSKGLLNFNV